MRKITPILILLLCVGAGCNTTANARRAIQKVQPGMTEARLREIINPHAQDTGTVYWGGSGAKRIYFHINSSSQIWFEMTPGPESKVAEIGAIEPKAKWVKHSGDSISVKGGPTRQ